MQRRTVIASVGAILGTSVGAAAFTSATVSRDATFTVATDASSALIGLNAGSTAGITETGDALAISLADLNTGGSFVYGDGADIANAYAFSITNNDSNERSFTLGYDTAGVTFGIYQQGTAGDWSDAALVDTVDSTTDVNWTATAGEAVRVVMTVDTSGVASGATDLDGTLTVSAN